MHIYPKRAVLQELGNEIFKLVSYGATPEQWAEWLRVPLEHAAARGNLGLVNTLLQAGADGSAGWSGCRGRTLLDASAVGGNVDVVMALLGASAHADVDVVSLSPKRSALYVATVCGHEEVARRLILTGADVRFEDPVDHCSVLHQAVDGGHEQLVNDLLVTGADFNSVFGPEGSTPLHQAATSGYAGIVSALLLRGANKDALDRNGATPLMWAASWGHLTAVETLLDAGADFSIRNDLCSDSALDYAAGEGCIPVIKTILRYGADVNSRGRTGCSALHQAAMYNQSGAIDALVGTGANMELESIDGETPLFFAAFEGYAESLLALLRRGAVVKAHDKLGQTPLHIACREKARGVEVVVDLLLRWGADEAALTNDGQPPAALLDVDPFENERKCSQEKVERVRLLLARAPADRAWRRRSWVVMLRSRAGKEKACSHFDAGGGSNTNTNLVGDRGGEACKAARTESSSSVLQEGRGQICSSAVGRAGGGEGGIWDLKGVVAQLLGLELEGVFRTTVGFL